MEIYSVLQWMNVLRIITYGTCSLIVHLLLYPFVLLFVVNLTFFIAAVIVIIVYQTVQRFDGFNWLPSRQLYALLNSGKFDSTPITRNISGLCSSISTCCNAAASFLCPHQN